MMRHKKKINAKAEWFKLKRGSTKDNSVPDSEHTHDKPVGWYYFVLAGDLNTNSNTGHVKSVNTFLMN